MFKYREINPCIDAVVTWVDGDDHAWIEKKKKKLNDIKNKTWKQPLSGKAITRFKNNNEIYFCLSGIHKNLPWVRRIFLVTDGQKPDFLTEELMEKWRISIVDHKIIYRDYEFYLPIFNSRSIETTLHRIPDLSDNYIYFNDDVIPVRPVAVDDFFREKKVVVRGKWEKHKIEKIPTFLLAIAMKIATSISKKERSPHVLAQIKAANIAGFKDSLFKSFHAPHPVHKKTLEDFFASNRKSFEKNISYPFRHIDQFVAHPLAHHLEASNGNMVENPGHDCHTLNGIHDLKISEIDHIFKDEKIKFICIQSLEKFAFEKQEKIISSISYLIDR